MKVPRGYGDEYEDPLEPGNVYGRPMPWRAPKPPAEWVIGNMVWELYWMYAFLPSTYLLVGGPAPAVLLLFRSYREALFPVKGDGSRGDRLAPFMRDNFHTLAMTSFLFLGTIWVAYVVGSLFLARKPDARRWVGYFGLAWCGAILLTGLLRAAAWKAAH